jgi:hypothetical protein
MQSQSLRKKIQRIYPEDTFFFYKGLVAVCHSFCLFLFFITFIQYNHPITYIQYIRRGLSPSPHRLWLSGKDLPVVPSRESNSGLPSSKPTHYQLSHAAPHYFLDCYRYKCFLLLCPMDEITNRLQS